MRFPDATRHSTQGSQSRRIRQSHCQGYSSAFPSTPPGLGPLSAGAKALSEELAQCLLFFNPNSYEFYSNSPEHSGLPCLPREGWIFHQDRRCLEYEKRQWLVSSAGSAAARWPLHSGRASKRRACIIGRFGISRTLDLRSLGRQEPGLLFSCSL